MAKRYRVTVDYREKMVAEVEAESPDEAKDFADTCWSNWDIAENGYSVHVEEIEEPTA